MLQKQLLPLLELSIMKQKDCILMYSLQFAHLVTFFIFYETLGVYFVKPHFFHSSIFFRPAYLRFYPSIQEIK